MPWYLSEGLACISLQEHATKQDYHKYHEGKPTQRLVNYIENTRVCPPRMYAGPENRGCLAVVTNNKQSL